MGDWGHQAWDSDDAADWFHRFWHGGGMRLVVNELAQFDPRSARYDRVRAACHVLIAFGSPYCWPSNFSDAERRQSLDAAATLLSHMLNPPTADWQFLAHCEHDAAVLNDVRRQQQHIQQLRNALP